MKGIISPTIIIAAVVLLFIGLAATGILPVGTILTGGFTIESIDAVDVLIGDQVNPQGYFRISAIANRGSEYIYGTITPTQFEQESGYETERGFDIRLDGLKETARFQVDNQDTNTAWYLYVDENEIVLTNCDWECGGLLGVLCIKKMRNLIVTDVDLPSIKSEVDVTATVGTKAEQVSISSDQPSGQFSFGNVQWVGGLSTGNQPPSANDYEATFDRFAEYWRLVRTSNFYRQQYYTEQAAITAYLTQQCEEWIGDTNVVRDRVTNFAGFYDRYKAQDDSISDGFVWNTRSTLEGDVHLDYTLPIYTMNPALIFTIDAVEVGIKINVGIPNILSVVSPEFHSGDMQGRIDTTVRNDGATAGSFAFSLENCDKFGMVYAITGEQFAAYQTRTVSMPIKTLGAAVDTTETCSVRVCDTSGFGTCDTESVLIHMLVAEFCTAGNQIVDGLCIKECRNNEYVTLTCCTADQVIALNLLGQYECQSGAGGGEWPDILSMLVSAVGLFMAGLVIAFVILIILIVLGMFIPALGFLVALKSIKIFVIALIVLAIVIAFMFTPFTASVYRGVVANIL